jgi:hypothetical protein
MRYPHSELATRATPSLDQVTVGLCFLGLETLQRVGLASDISATLVLGRLGVEIRDAEEAEDLRFKYMMVAQTYVVEGMSARLKTVRAHGAQ